MNVVTPRMIIVAQVFESHEIKKIAFEAKHEVCTTVHIFITKYPAYLYIDLS